MKKTLACLLTLALSLSLFACSPGGGTAQELTDGRSENIVYTYDGSCSPVSAFALALLGQTVSTGEDNPVISPLSAYLALAMAADGAGGDTARQFDALLQMSQSDRDAMCAALRAALTDTAGSTTLNLAQSAWLDEDTEAREEYLQQIVNVFDAQLYAADLDTEETRSAINDWVKERTNGLIPELLAQNLDPDAAMVLLNTLYFLGSWEIPFPAEDTWDGSFCNEDGTEAQTDFMHRTGSMTVVENGAWEGVLLPYDDGRTAFLALKVRDMRCTAGEPTLRERAAQLSGADWQALLSGGSTQEVALALPRLDMDFTITLNDALQALGLVDAFDPERADFSPMGTRNGNPLYVSTVLQKVRLKVGEKGTEAAAATAVLMAEASAAPDPEPPRSMVFDSPFLYAVVDLDSQTPLFLGLATNLG